MFGYLQNLLLILKENMFLLFHILFVIVLPCVFTEDYLKHYASQGIAIMPKLWFGYVTKFQDRAIHQIIVLTKNTHLKMALYYTSEQIKKIESRSKHIDQYNTRNQCFINESQSVLLPLSHILFYSQIHKVCPVTQGIDNFAVNAAKMLDYIRGLGGFFDLQFTFKFIVESQLRINLSFVYIYIPNMLGSCYTNNLQIYEQYRMTDFVFCGILTDFKLYPFSNQVNITASLKEAFPLRFQFTGSIFSENILFNQEQFTNAKLKPIAIHNFIFL